MKQLTCFVVFAYVLLSSIVAPVVSVFGKEPIQNKITEKTALKPFPPKDDTSNTKPEKVNTLRSVGYEPSATLAKITDETLRHGLYYVLVPPVEELKQYEYLGHYPITAFLFVNVFNPQVLSKFTVNELKRGYLWYQGIFPLNQIKGFEEIAEKIRTSDDFWLADKKSEIISKLISCYENYYKDWTKFANAHSYYVFEEGRLSSARDQKKACGGLGLPTEGKITCTMFYYYHKVPRTNYDFDKKSLKMPIFHDDVGFYYESSDSGLGSNWRGSYMDKFNDKYRNNRVLFPKTIEIAMSLDDARKLFGDKQAAHCRTLFTVKPKIGIFGKTYFNSAVTDFDIYKIVKKCYQEGADKNSSPTLIVEFESTPNKPFY
jgi:hypothetical protein